MLHLLYTNPWRPPDSSWQRATRLVEIGGDEPQATFNRDGRSCSWIKQTQRFQHALNHANTHRQRMEVLAEYPAIHQAHSVWQKLATDERAIPWGIEARILARETDEEIARKNSCRPEVVAAYEALFFNVRSRLDYSDYIFNCVVGPAPEQSSRGDVDGWLWKLCGYVAGPFVLDALIDHIPNPLWVHGQDEVPSFLQATTISIIKQKAAIAALLVPVEGRNHMRLIKVFVKYLEIEQRMDSYNDANDTIQENLRKLLESLPYTSARIAAAKRLPGYDRAAAEPSTSEPLEIAAGNTVPEAEEVDTLRFPEPERVASER